MRGIYLTVRAVATEGLPDDSMVKSGRVMVGNNGALHQARVHPTMANPFHSGVEVWQTADGQFLYNVKHWVELSEPIPPHALV